MTHLRIGLASPAFPLSADDAARRAIEYLGEAADAGVHVVCFPECLVPGMRGQGFPVAPPDQRAQADALERISAAARLHGVAAIVPMEWDGGGGLQNVAFVVSAAGDVVGFQAKNQLPPEEVPYFVPGSTRRLFTVNDVPFGIVICHEGWRYPETVRWAATRGAKIVFHPHYHGGPEAAPYPARFAAPESSIFEKAMMVRAAENNIFFASVNFALPSQDSGAFKQTIAQINDLMKRDGEAAPTQVAAAPTLSTAG